MADDPARLHLDFPRIAIVIKFILLLAENHPKKAPGFIWTTQIQKWHLKRLFSSIIFQFISRIDNVHYV